jgi:hypothetical protein
MKKWMIINKAGLYFASYYESEVELTEIEGYGPEFFAPICVHKELPEGLDKNCIKVELIDGDYIISEDTDKANAKQARLFAQLRQQRNSKLQECDYTQLVDAPLSVEQKALWAIYRQALRDLPANTLIPSNPVWPTQPE